MLLFLINAAAAPSTAAAQARSNPTCWCQEHSKAFVSVARLSASARKIRLHFTFYQDETNIINGNFKSNKSQSPCASRHWQLSGKHHYKLNSLLPHQHAQLTASLMAEVAAAAELARARGRPVPAKLTLAPAPPGAAKPHDSNHVPSTSPACRSMRSKVAAPAASCSSS